MWNAARAGTPATEIYISQPVPATMAPERRDELTCKKPDRGRLRRPCITIGFETRHATQGGTRNECRRAIADHLEAVRPAARLSGYAPRTSIAPSDWVEWSPHHVTKAPLASSPEHFIPANLASCQLPASRLSVKLPLGRARGTTSVPPGFRASGHVQSSDLQLIFSFPPLAASLAPSTYRAGLRGSRSADRVDTRGVGCTARVQVRPREIEPSGLEHSFSWRRCPCCFLWFSMIILVET